MRKTGEEAKRVAKDGHPFGPGFSDEVIERLHTLEIWHSSFKDPGDDYNLFKAFSATGELIAEKRSEGY